MNFRPLSLMARTRWLKLTSKQALSDFLQPRAALSPTLRTSGTILAFSTLMSHTLVKVAGSQGGVIRLLRYLPVVDGIPHQVDPTLTHQPRALFGGRFRLWGSDPAPQSYVLMRWLFLRALGLIYLVAFVSLGLQ